MCSSSAPAPSASLRDACWAAAAGGSPSSSAGPSPTPSPARCTSTTRSPAYSPTTGIDPAAPAVSEPADFYDWQNADGDTLLHFDWSGPGPSGWPTATMFHQPDLERALADGRRRPRRRSPCCAGTRRSACVDRGDRVEIAAPAPTVTARSPRPGSSAATARTASCRSTWPTEMTDLGFFYDWLIVDVVPNEQRTWYPTNLQICDPARPTTAVSGGPGRRRWEFMRDARRGRRRAQHRGHRVGPARPVGPHPRQRHARAAHRLHLPGPLGRAAGGRAGCCSPATPPTSCRRSPGRACAPGSATPPTSPGSSTSSSPGTPTTALLDTYTASAARTSSTPSACRSNSARSSA